MEEDWLPVKEFEGYYEVSNLGRVRGVERFVKVRGGGVRKVRSAILKSSLNTKGYLQLMLCKDGVQTAKSVHRLVAGAFIPEIDGKGQVNHIDGDKTNNIFHNLEWVDNSENALHAFKLGLRKPRGHSRIDVSERKRFVLSKRSEGYTNKEISEMIGVCTVTVSRIATDYFERKRQP